VRTIHTNRRERRAAQCIKPRRPRSDGEPAPYRRALALRAYGGDLARLAEDIADELELSPDQIDDLLWPGFRRT
jgi:hypothetical protein